MYDINCINVTHSFHRPAKFVILPTSSNCFWILLSCLISLKPQKSGEMKSYNSLIGRGNAVHDIWKIKASSPRLKFELVIK